MYKKLSVSVIASVMALSRLIWSGSELGVGAKSASRAALAVSFISLSDAVFGKAAAR